MQYLRKLIINVNLYLQAIRHIGLPEVFTPETTDVYDRKNMPRVVFCLHALSLFLYKVRKSVNFAFSGLPDC